MRTRIRNRNLKAHGQPENALVPALFSDVVADDPGDVEVLSLAEEQMLVNQALVEKVFACQDSEAALRASEQQLHSLLAHQRATRDAERKDFSRQIHDSLGQNLLALRLDIVTLHQQTNERHGRLHGWVGAALDNVDETLRTVKHLLSELRPAGFDLGLIATLEIEARKFTLASGIACELQAQDSIETLALDEDTLMSMHRVLQEALNNVFRHSLASRVQLSLTIDDGMIELTIADNGIGFDPQAPRKSSSFGLATQQEQIAAQGGTLSIVSARTQGTRLVARLPITPAQAPPARFNRIE